MKRVFIVALCLLAPVSAVAQTTTAACANASPTTRSGYATPITISCTGLTAAALRAARTTVATAPASGTATDTNATTAAGASVTYTPPASFTGTDSFTVRVRSGSVDIALVTVTVTVQANAGPVCTAATAGAQAASTTSLRFSNCRDADSPLRTTTCCTYAIAEPAVYGSAAVSASGTSVTYTSTREDQPLDGFRLTATDSGGAASSFSVKVNVELPTTGTPSDRSTFLLSRSLAGGFPDGASRGAAISHDQRIARYMAFESEATNLVARDPNKQTDVFVVARKRPWGTNGTAWEPGPIRLASAGRGGRAANGGSWGASLDGDAHHAAHCVAFVSTASNLVRGDRDRRADAFVRDLRSGVTRRVSTRGGSVSSVTIDGECGRAAYVAGGRAYAHFFRGNRENRGRVGKTVLVSATRGGRRGNGRVGSAEISRDGGSVAFDTKATNLDRRDRTRAADVYRKDVTSGRLDLVSRSSSGRAGNGASTAPSITDQGDWVAYETSATNLAGGDTDAGVDVVRTHVRGRSVGHDLITAGGNGVSGRPVISGAGEFVLFDSLASNFKQAESSRDVNNARDVFLWNKPTGNISRESRTPANETVIGPSGEPATSSRGNYVAFVSPSRFVDTTVLDRVVPGWAGDLTTRVALDAQGKDKSANQVYVRYLGPK